MVFTLCRPAPQKHANPFRTPVHAADRIQYCIINYENLEDYGRLSSAIL